MNLYINENGVIGRFIFITIFFLILTLLTLYFFHFTKHSLNLIILEDLKREFDVIAKLSKEDIFIIKREPRESDIDNFLDLKPIWQLNFGDEKISDISLILDIKKNIDDLNTSLKSKIKEYFRVNKNSSIYYFFDEDKERLYSVYKFKEKFILIEKSLREFYKSIIFIDKNKTYILLLILALYIISAFLNIKFSLKEEEIEELNVKHLKELDDIRDSALSDTLTGIYNRLKFNDSLEEFIMLTKRFKSKFSIILFDIDYFKKFNDTYGHQIGDEVLILVSKIVRENIRDVDIFARWGGEEFVVLLPNSDLKEALICAERMREAIAKFKLNTLPQITCSFGVAEYCELENKEELLKRVDDLLYSAKRAGRNCVKG